MRYHVHISEQRFPGVARFEFPQAQMHESPRLDGWRLFVEQLI